jgi:cytohesin
VLGADAEELRHLLAAGADPNARDDRGETPLHVAARDNDAAADALGVLIQHGAVVNVASTGGETPLHAACGYWALDAVRVLLRAGAAPGPADAAGETPLHRVARVRPRERLRGGGGFPYMASDAAGAWVYACKPAASAALLLARAGADVNAADHDGLTPLHHAASVGNALVAQVLLSRGADPLRADRADRSPLDAALAVVAKKDGRSVYYLDGGVDVAGVEWIIRRVQSA